MILQVNVCQKRSAAQEACKMPPSASVSATLVLAYMARGEGAMVVWTRDGWPFDHTKIEPKSAQDHT
jgi:hypothetical protein